MRAQPEADREEEPPCALRLPSREQGLAAGLTGSVLSPHSAPSRECDLQPGLRGHGPPHRQGFGFFPGNISVVWFWDEEPMSQDAQESGGVLPDGNGTYFTWETIKIPQGEEQRVKCIVEYSGIHSAHLAPLGETGVGLEAVVTLGGSEARVRERRAGCGSGVPGLYIIRSFSRKEPGVPEIMVDREHSCCCFYHRILCLMLY